MKIELTLIQSLLLLGQQHVELHSSVKHCVAHFTIPAPVVLVVVKF